MINNFSLYLALRYLRPKRTFVSVITLISVLGVSLGVAVLIVVIAVMAGFHAQIKELAMGYDAHIEAFDNFGTSMWPTKERPKDDVQEKSWRDVLTEIKATPGVVSASPMVRGMILVESPEGMAPTWMWGLKQEDGNRLAAKHEKLVKEGKLDLNGDNIVLDEGLAHAWGVQDEAPAGQQDQFAAGGGVAVCPVLVARWLRSVCAACGWCGPVPPVF